MELFKLRASCVGKITSNPKSKEALISETSKTYVEEWVKSQIYGVRKSIQNKYLEKGIEFEDQAIDKTIEWLDLGFVLKNKTRFEDEFFTGEPDLILEETVIDIKNSWDCFTFPLFENEIPTKDYFYQLQVYMHLTGKRKAKLVYVLLNTPATYNTEEIDYSNIDKKYRIKTFDIVYDECIIEDLKDRILKIRTYIETLNK